MIFTPLIVEVIEMALKGNAFNDMLETVRRQMSDDEIAASTKMVWLYNKAVSIREQTARGKNYDEAWSVNSIWRAACEDMLMYAENHGWRAVHYAYPDLYPSITRLCAFIPERLMPSIKEDS